MVKLAQGEERVRFCDGCNSVISWHADVCEECGANADTQPEGSSAIRSSNEVEKDLFRAHLRLLHRAKADVEMLGKEIAPLERKLKVLGAKPKQAATAEVTKLADRVLELEQVWEEIQRTYNRQAESVEEDFVERTAELEADLELTVDHQEAVDTEVLALHRGLEKEDARLRELGQGIQRLEAQRRSGVLGFSLQRPGGRAGLAILGMLLFGLGAYLGTTRFGLSPAALALILGRGAAAFLVVLVASARTRP